jgi:hypothetical protein
MPKLLASSDVIFLMPELQRSCDMRNIDAGQRISNLRDKRGQAE